MRAAAGRALVLTAALAALAASPALADPLDACAPEDDDEALACLPHEAEAQAQAAPAACLPGDADAGPAADSGGVDAGAAAAFAEATIGGARVRLFPARIRPGAFYAIDVVGQGLRSAAGSFGALSVPLFARGPGHFRGFGAVPLDYPAQPSLVHVAVVGQDMKPASGSLPLLLQERQVIRKSITVDSKFTSPSAQQVAQMKADSRALSEAYRVPFGPPRFESAFVDPLGHARGSRFGERRVFNGKTRSRHWGLDIDGEAGEPVHAANDGLVVLARSCFMSGNTVILSHGAGLFTGYLHFSRFAVKAGQAVKRGDLLGYVGSTGRATGPHLHVAARLNESLIDPEDLFAFDFTLGGEEPQARDAGTGDSGTEGDDAGEAEAGDTDRCEAPAP